MNTAGSSHSYVIQAEITRTKYHVIYKAKNMATDQIVAIKAIDAKWLRNDDVKAELRAEAEICKKLSHPNICNTLAVFEEDNSFYIVREYVEGKSLKIILQELKYALDVNTCFKWLIRILNALEHAHALGIYHRNLNPDNVLIDENDQPQIMGFGKPNVAWLKVDNEAGIYHPLHYTAPEVFHGESVSPESDIYSIGVMAYVMLCRRLPWSLTKDSSNLQQKQDSMSRPVLNPEFFGDRIPDWLFSIINKCLMIEKSYRIPTPAELTRVLKAEQSFPFEPVTKPGVIDIKLNRELEPAIVEEPKIEETIVPEPVILEEPEIEETIVPEPEPIVETQPKSVMESKPVPKSEPKPKSLPKIIAIESEDEEEDSMPRLKKLFMIMLVLSLAIIIFIAFKYYVFSDKPVFEKPRTEEVAEAPDLPGLIANEPIQMTVVPADTVIVGSMSPLADPDEFPIKKVRLRSFKIGIHEVTQKEWMMVYSNNPSRFLGEDRPVENVSFYDAIDFCNDKSLMDGFTPCYSYVGEEIICDFNANGYRLPTEAEWEHAAKGAYIDIFFTYSGSDKPHEAGWYNENSGASTNVAGQKAPNPLGIFDMSGNVFEWVWNWYSQYSYRMRDVYSGAETGTDKVIRGGSWYHNSHEMRVTNRNFAKPFSKTNYIGFRVVRTLY